MLMYYASQLNATSSDMFYSLNFDISSGNLNVSNGNTSMVTQDLCAKVIISECFLIAAMEQTNKIGRTFINPKALFYGHEDISGRRKCEPHVQNFFKLCSKLHRVLLIKILQ